MPVSFGLSRISANRNEPIGPSSIRHLADDVLIIVSHGRPFRPRQECFQTTTANLAKPSRIVSDDSHRNSSHHSRSEVFSVALASFSASSWEGNGPTNSSSRIEDNEHQNQNLSFSIRAESWPSCIGHLKSCLIEMRVPRDQELVFLQGILVPAGTPKQIVDLLNREIIKALAMPDVADRLATIGFYVSTNSPEEFAALIKSEIAKWGRVVHEAGIEQIR